VVRQLARGAMTAMVVGWLVAGGWSTTAGAVPAQASSSPVTNTMILPRVYGTAPTGKVAVGETVSIRTEVQNSGAETWLSWRAHVNTPAVLDILTITVRGLGTGDASIVIQSTCGPDRVSGTADDSDFEPLGTVAAGAQVVLQPRDGSFPGGALPPGCFVSRLFAEPTGSLAAGAGGTLFELTGPVMAVGRDAVAVEPGLVFQSVAPVLFTTPTDTYGETSIAYGQIDQLPSVVSVGHTVSGEPPAGSVEVPVRLAARVISRPMANPVLTVVLPAGSTVSSWSMGDSDAGLPTPTLTVIDGFAGGVLARWTFPDGTVWPADKYASIDYTVRLASPLNGGLNLPGFVSSRSQRPDCDGKDDTLEADSLDLDNDGDLDEVPCQWTAKTLAVAEATTSTTTTITTTTTLTATPAATPSDGIPERLAMSGVSALRRVAVAAALLVAGLALVGMSARRRSPARSEGLEPPTF
jgi:hypothetical protein